MGNPRHEVIGTQKEDLGRLMGKGTRAQRQNFQFLFFHGFLWRIYRRSLRRKPLEKILRHHKVTALFVTRFTSIIMTRHDFDRGFLHFAAVDVVYLFAWAAPFWDEDVSPSTGSSVFQLEAMKNFTEFIKRRLVCGWSCDLHELLWKGGGGGMHEVVVWVVGRREEVRCESCICCWE